MTQTHSRPLLGFLSAGLPKKFVDIFQQTPLGRFLAQLHGEPQQELLQCYSKDFILLTMRVATEEELEVDVQILAKGQVQSLHDGDWMQTQDVSLAVWSWCCEVWEQNMVCKGRQWVKGPSSLLSMFSAAPSAHHPGAPKRQSSPGTREDLQFP